MTVFNIALPEIFLARFPVHLLLQSVKTVLYGSTFAPTFVISRSFPYEIPAVICEHIEFPPFHLRNILLESFSVFITDLCKVSKKENVNINDEF